MLLMNDQEDTALVRNNFTNADATQWFQSLTAFVLEFLNLVSDIILFTFGMKGRFLSRFACYSKSTSVDNMSDTSGERVIVPNSSKTTNKVRCRSSVSESDVHIEFEPDNTVQEIRQHNNGGGDKVTPRTSKSRIPRLVPLCGKQQNSKTEVRYEDPMELIKAFNKFVREYTPRRSNKKLFGWISVFDHTIIDSEKKYKNKTVDILRRNQLTAIKKKREELSKLFENERSRSSDVEEELKSNGFQRIIDNISCCTERRVHSNCSQSGGDAGSKERLTVIKSPAKVNTDGKITDEVYPLIEKLCDRKLSSTGEDEIMEIVSKEYYEVRKITSGEMVPDRSEYRELYPLSLTQNDVLVRTIVTRYSIGKDKCNLQLMHKEDHKCSPVSSKCSICQQLRERGYFSATEVKAIMFKNCHSVLEQKCRVPDRAFLDDLMTRTSEKVPEKKNDIEPQSVEHTTVSVSKVAKSPYKGGRCSSKDTRIAKGLAQPKAQTPGPRKIDNVTTNKGDVSVVVNQFGKPIEMVKPTNVTPFSPTIIPPTTPTKQETPSTSPTTPTKQETPSTSPTTPIVHESPQKGNETSVTTKGKGANKGKTTRRSASARRRRKSVPPSKDQHNAPADDSEVPSKPVQHESVTLGEPVQENSISKALSADKPKPAPLPGIAGPITADGLPTDELLIDFSDTPKEINVQQPVVKEQAPAVVDDTPKPLHFIDTDNEPIIEEEPKEPVYQDIDATVDLSRNTVEPRYGDKPNKKKLQAEIQDREKIKTKGQANKHLKSAKPKFVDDSMEEEFVSFDDSGCGDVTFEDADDEVVDNVENEETGMNDNKDVEPEVINAVDQPQIMDDREFKMIPEEILRKDSDKLKDIEEMYGMCEKKDKKKKKERKTKPKKLTIPLTY